MEWKKIQDILISMLLKAKLLREEETVDDLMNLVSKLESNSFGLYVAKGKKKKAAKEMVCFGRGMRNRELYMFVFNILI